MQKLANILGLALAVAALVAWTTFQAGATLAEAQRYTQPEAPIVTEPWTGPSIEADPWTEPFMIPSVGIGF
jgi:hypothetical protein